MKRQDRGYRKKVWRSKGELTAVQNVLSSALRRHGLDQHINRYKFVLDWDKIVGPDIAARSRPESLRNGLLKIRVIDATWAQELSFYKSAILKRLQRFLDEEQSTGKPEASVRDVYFYVGGE